MTALPHPIQQTPHSTQKRQERGIRKESKMHLDIPVTRIKPIYQPNPTQLIQETRPIQHTINALHLDLHPEGGYFRETDRDTRQVPSSFAQAMVHTDVASRSVSSCILYFLTPQQPLGCFHRNNGRTVHVWQRGRGRYVIIHADEIEGQGRCEMKARVETFIVGPDVEARERLQWVVEGGKYKSSFLLPDEPGGETSGLLITEVVIPGFNPADHEFLHKDKMDELLTAEQVTEMSWMLKDCP